MFGLNSEERREVAKQTGYALLVYAGWLAPALLLIIKWAAWVQNQADIPSPLTVAIAFLRKYDWFWLGPDAIETTRSLAVFVLVPLAWCLTWAFHVAVRRHATTP